MLRGGISDPRNKAIMKMLNLLSIGERAGSGVPDIFSVWDSQEWQSPDVREEYNPDRTTLTLPFVKKQAEKTSGNAPMKKTAIMKNNIIDFLRQRESASSQEIAEAISRSVPRSRVLIAELCDEGILRPSGEGRNRRYRFVQMPVADTINDTAKQKL